MSGKARWWLSGGAILFVAGSIYFLSGGKEDVSSRPAEPDRGIAVETARPSAPKKTIVMHPIASDLPVLNSPETTPEDDLATIELVFLEYAKHHDGNPEGENVEITAALMGENAKGISFLPSSGGFLDKERRMIDRWGTPYFFHQQSARRTEIISAGPDRQFHTDDDLMR